MRQGRPIKLIHNFPGWGWRRGEKSNILWQISTAIAFISPSFRNEATHLTLYLTQGARIIVLCAAVVPLGTVDFLPPDQQSAIHCLICGIQLLTPNSIGDTWRRIYSPDIRTLAH